MSVVTQVDDAHDGEYSTIYVGDFSKLKQFSKEKLISIINGQAEMMRRVPQLVEELAAAKKNCYHSDAVIERAAERIEQLKAELGQCKREIAGFKEHVADIHARHLLCEGNHRGSVAGPREGGAGKDKKKVNGNKNKSRFSEGGGASGMYIASQSG